MVTESPSDGASPRSDSTSDAPNLTSVPEPGPGRTRRIFRTLWKVVKRLLILAIIAGIGLAVYFGWPEVQSRYLDPITSNSQGVSDLENQSVQLEARIALLEQEVVDLAGADAGIPERLDGLDASSVEAAGAITELGSQLEALERRLDRLADELDGIATDQSTLQSEVAGATADMAAQVELLKAMELLSRARLFVYQANYGLAEQDVVTAIGILGALDAATLADGVLDETLFRLDRVVAALPTRPALAADDLDIAWQVLLDNRPVVTEIAPPSEEAPPEG